MDNNATKKSQALDESLESLESQTWDSIVIK